MKPGGKLAVVSFHSLEDRIVKRFLQLASGHEANANRYAPARHAPEPRFTLTGKATGPDDQELAEPAFAQRETAHRPPHRRPRPVVEPDRRAATPERPPLMRPVFYILSFLSVLALAFWAYRENYAPSASSRKWPAAGRNRQIARGHWP